jgi:UDPglucose 6-dehydrogenase
MRISVIGLGKLGAPLAAVLASKGFRVIGTDLNREFVDAINNGAAPVDEPRLQELITAHREWLSATLDIPAAVEATDVTFIIVPTPSDASGRFSNAAVFQALESVGAGIRRKDTYHLVVVTSTVMPGSTGGEIRLALERHAGRQVGSTLGLCYSPEFIALGSVVSDMLRPDMVLIGESDTRAGNILAQLYQTTCESRPVVQRMNFVNAELTKLAINTFVTNKISYANMLAEICERLAGADVDVVTRAVGSDSRIGTKYLKGAIGYGGPCFPRDNVALSTLARSLGAQAQLAETTDAINRMQIERVLTAVESRFPGSGTIGILGLSYKPDTSVISESQAVFLLERLLDLGRHVVAYDPKALPVARQALRRSFDSAPSAAACVRAASLVVVMTPWREFGDLDEGPFIRPEKRLTVIDCWRVLPAAVSLVADVVYLGQGATEGASTVAL